MDVILGPEMRSTGEVLGIADSFGLAFYKAQKAAKMTLPETGTVLISVSRREHHNVLEVAEQFTSLGFKILATEGTHNFLKDNGIASEQILKLHEGRPNIVDSITNKAIQLIVNTPIGKRSQHDDSYIRKAAIKYKIPYITTATAAAATAKGIAARQGNEAIVKSLQEYHADLA